MFFGSKKRRETQGQEAQAPGRESLRGSPSIAAMKRAIADHERDDPTIRAVLTGKEITARAPAWFKDERGVRVERVLGGLGALAGFCAVFDVAGRVAEGRLKAAIPGVAIVGMEDGSRFWSGDEIDRLVAEDRYSVWGLTGGMAQKLGAAELPDVGAIFQRVAGALGAERFGIADLPPEHMPGDSAQTFVREVFPVAVRVLRRYDLPRGQWPLAVAFSTQDAMEMAKDQLDPALMARIVMEMAIPASRLDPERLLA